MAIVSFGTRALVRSCNRYDARPRVVSFQPACRGGMLAGGVLTVECEGLPRALQVSMTWDALDVLRSELGRHGVDPGDATIVRRVLTQWGVEEYLARLERGDHLAAEGLVLRLAVGPASREPRRLLAAAGLLLPTAA